MGQGSTRLVHLGVQQKWYIFLHVIYDPSDLWIVDSRASDHMTGVNSLFSTYSPCTKKYKVQIVDGSLSDLSGIGEVVLFESITLKFALVPNLKHN